MSSYKELEQTNRHTDVLSRAVSPLVVPHVIV